jgi:hypothetical protein
MDFGVGFYVTTFFEQAKVWAKLKAKRINGEAIVSVYSLDLTALKANCLVKEFKGVNTNWLDFVIIHRRISAYQQGLPKPNVHHHFDTVMGEVADDRVYSAIEEFENGKISKAKLVRQLKYKAKNDQLCFSTEKGLNYLTYKNYII